MGRNCHRTLSEVTTWVKDACKYLPAEIILTGFKKCCILNALDGNEDDVIWDAKDACGESDDDNFPHTSDDEDTPGSN